MCQNEHENQNDPETRLSAEVTFQPDGWMVEVSRAGTVRYSDRGFKTRTGAEAAGQVFARAWLRAQLAATGVARRAERPAYEPPRVTPVANLHDIVGGPAGELDGDQLEGEQLCTCSHSDGVHEVLAGPCHAAGCFCEEFTPEEHTSGENVSAGEEVRS